MFKINKVVIVLSTTIFLCIPTISTEKIQSPEFSEKINPHNEFFEDVKPIMQSNWVEARVSIDKPVGFFLAFNDKEITQGGKPLYIQTWFEAFKGNGIKKVISKNHDEGELPMAYPQKKIVTIDTDDRTTGYSALQLNVLGLAKGNALSIRAFDAQVGTQVTLTLYIDGNWKTIIFDNITTSLKEYKLNW